MSVERVHAALDTVATLHKKELERLNKALEDQTKTSRELQMKLDTAQELAATLTRARDRALQKLEDRESKLVAARADAHAQIETLKAEKEIIALRDREARDELERLSHRK